MPLEINITNITGSTDTEAEFSASFLNVTNTSQSVGIQWDFISVPTASQIAKIPTLPDNSSAGGWTDMSDNTTLFHFNEIYTNRLSPCWVDNFRKRCVGSHRK